MNNKSNKFSITKKSSWSLILAAKYFKMNSFDNVSRVTVEKSLNKKNYKYEYDIEKQEVISSNFDIDSYTDNLFTLYLPIIFNNKKTYLIGHLAQTLDGFIATKSNESKYISSKENLTHIHMLRAISDIILVGSNTVKSDNPMLTTRLVKGENPMRIILDKSDKISKKYNVFSNKDGNGYKIISDKLKQKNPNIFQLPLVDNQFDERDIISLLTKLNKKIVFIEGGGKTISRFYKKDLLDKLHLCISPIILGEGISSFVIPKQRSLKEVDEHKISYIKMGSDILCDIDLF